MTRVDDTMKPKERFLTALNHEEPDRVPIFDLGVDAVWLGAIYRVDGK